MKKVSWRILAAGLGLAMLQAAVSAEDKPALNDQKEKASYSIGMNIGNTIKAGGVDLDVDVLAAAIKDVLAGRDPKLTEQQAMDAMNTYRSEVRAKREEARVKTIEK